MVWLGPGFHPKYSGVQPKISVLFCQWFSWSHSRFLPLWLRWASWPFPAELRSPFLLWLNLYPTFLSGKSLPRSVISSDFWIRVVVYIWDLRIWLGLLRLVIWSWIYRLRIWGWVWIHRPFQRPWWAHPLEISWLWDRRAAPVGTRPKTWDTTESSASWRLVMTSDFPKAMGEEALGSCPLALGSQGCWRNGHCVLKAMFLRYGLVSSYLLT